MFLGIYGIDEYVPIPPVTHRFSSGAAYAPTAITYSIYEEGNTTGLDEDVDMTPASPFDSVTGFYYARRQLTAAAGFENNKTYVVLVKATVDSVEAIESHVFQIRPLQTGDSYAIVNGDHGLVSIQDDIDTLLTRIVGTLLAGNHTAQSADNNTILASGTHGLSALKTLIDALQADIGDASSSTLGSIYAILGNAAAAIAGRLPAALESGNMPVHVKAQDNIDFGALQKASITAAVPSASAIGTDAASKVLVTPAQKLVTDANGYVTYSNAAPPSADDVKAAMEANGSKLDHLWEMTEDDGGTRRLTANALEEAPSGTGLDAAGVRAAIGMADANLDTQLAALPTAAENADAVWDETSTGHIDAGKAGQQLWTDINSILDDTGTSGVLVSGAGIDAIFDRNSSLSISFETLINRIYQMINDKMEITDATGAVSLKNIAGTGEIATGNVSDDSTTTTRDGLTWV